MKWAIGCLAGACLISGLHAESASQMPASPPGAAPHWSYDGSKGPSHWAEIDKAFQACESGKSESPVNINTTTKAPPNTPRIQFFYEAMPVHLLNTGHAIQFGAQPSKDSVTLAGRRYQLIQFHFHSPGEERFAGRASPMDMHLVHADADGKLLVVAVQFIVGPRPNPVLGALLQDMPQHAGGETMDKAVMINPSGLLPEPTSGYYTYSGSLTTPPCSEGVTWIELKEPVRISAAQLKAMRRFYYHNQRPIQPLNGREVIEVD
ncbi:carbonic anhydrase family protein [Caballeronia sp. LZ035]|uniref:carbonic anhydrase n=1 Tax=Caballeronia sp. LZ035 TaxID=3038568 RepID=UPI002854D904|nr:carbonic anhydrase family protein [Caballeronia sp. LZ035]MDR5758846.1 carbonic anhydrase family protein [Caballeronia sp. LZ035]